MICCMQAEVLEKGKVEPVRRPPRADELDADGSNPAPTTDDTNKGLMRHASLTFKSAGGDGLFYVATVRAVHGDGDFARRVSKLAA